MLSVSEEFESGQAGRRVVVEGVETEQTCPDCGVLTGKVHTRKLRRIEDLPHGTRPPLRVEWGQRRWACRERAPAQRPRPAHPSVGPSRHRARDPRSAVTLQAAAYSAHPDRFRRQPTPPSLPTAEWINQPTTETLIQND